ncbi:MAG: enoyl-CoA hydratase-related protein [Bacteroidetes bacterium]|jgi:2-(1,2-epoxy-1,2-dihydrophenyl)acetyl-CoA isomerase|nr:enoyl-CoA hydratase-related protein [Bacteroidota bacterium]
MSKTAPVFEHVLYELSDGILTLTLNRPEVYNAFNDPMSYALIDALKAARKDPAVRVLVLTGAGDKAFCSGQDLKAIAGKQRSLADSVEKRYNPIARLLYTIEKPIIARVNGVAAGAGAGIVLACDLAIAAEHASFVFAFANIGLVPDTATSFALPRLVGRRKAFELATLGSKIPAAEALQYGFVNRVVPADQLDATVAELAQLYRDKAPIAIGLIKRMLLKSAHADLEDMLQMEAYCQQIAGSTEDYAEAVSAFNEKRKPLFAGK